MAEEINIGIRDVAVAQLIDCVPEVLAIDVVEVVPCMDAAKPPADKNQLDKD